MAYLIFQSDKILVFATANSSNTKTGPGTHLWIMDRSMHPVESRKTGNDAKTCCGGCRLASNNGCYSTPLPLMQIWKSYIEGLTPFVEPGSSRWSQLFVNQFVRFGAYGNPSMIPLPLVRRIIKDCRAHTGYFHDWAILKPSIARAYGKYFMASCDETNWEQAHALNLRTYTVSSKPLKNHTECLNVTKYLPCNVCCLCSGTKGGTKHVAIRAHGYQIKKAQKNTELVVS